MSDDINQNTRIELKRIADVGSLSAAQVNEVLQKSAQWITNFYSEAAGSKKVKGDFAVEGFSYGGEFDLSTAKDIIDGLAPPRGRVPFLFLSDLVNFIEQIRTSLSSKNYSLDSIQRQELDKLGSTFNLVGVNPANEKISVEELQKIEYFDYSRRIVERIKLIHLILKPSIGFEEIKIEEKNEDQKTAAVGGGGIDLGISGSKSKDKEQKEKDSKQDTTKQDDYKKPPEPAPPLKLSELDPEAKLYLQSLSIITINQALGKYFNEASLAKFGFSPGTRVTFDQLPLEVRRQLMDRAFLQVENLLLGGSFSLDELIKNPAQRISFSSQASLGLLMDAHGLNLLNSAVREIATAVNKTEQLEKNQQEKLTDEKVSQRIKNEKENVLNSQKAEEFLEKAGFDPDFARNIESKLNIINNEQQLDNTFFEQLRDIANTTDQTKIRQAIDSGKSYIEVLIQQGLPPEYIIPDPKNFDYNRFINIFGKNLDETQFNVHSEEIANLIIFYWKRKRAIWSREIRQEFGQEKYTPEEAQKLFEKISKDPEKLEAFRTLGLINLDQGGRYVSQQLAGQGEPISQTDDKLANALKTFQDQQQDLIKKYLEEKIAKLSQTDQQKTFKTYFEFYMPGVPQVEYSIVTFQEQIIPQINPMDFYMLYAAENFGEGSFTKDGNGYVQNAFSRGGNYQGTDFMDSALGQAATGLAAEGIGDALYLIPGFGEALLAAETTNPLIKELKNQVIEEVLKKVFEFVKKYWPALLAGALLSAFGGILAGLTGAALAYSALRNGLAGMKNLLSGSQKVLGKIGEGIGGVAGERAGLSNQAAMKQAKMAQLSTSGKTLASQLSPAMVTAGQAVIATFGVTALLVFIYQTSLNSAFLTDFPRNESEYMNSVEKTSKYAAITKTAKIKSGCLNLENEGSKCENPTFPVTIEYTITIKPKEDFTIQVTNLEDKIKFKQSKKGWEEAGSSPPSIESERALGFDYFKAIIKEQGGLSSESINTTPTPTPGSEIIDAENPAATQDNIVIPPGSELAFTYSIEDLDASYNHTAIINTIEANFYYQNAFMSGTDNVITASRVCLGDCSAGAGCWPSTGSIWQLPFGPLTHGAPGNSNNSWGDSYDIGCDNCSGAAIYGPPIYTQYDGTLCSVKCDNNQYGCRFILEFNDGGETRYIDYAHLQEPNPSLGENSCMQVEAGFLIGLMSNRGTGSVHLHFGIVNGASGGWWSARPALSITEQLVPEADNGNYPAKLYDHVTTCYE